MYWSACDFFKFDKVQCHLFPWVSCTNEMCRLSLYPTNWVKKRDTFSNSSACVNHLPSRTTKSMNVSSSFRVYCSLNRLQFIGWLAGMLNLLYM